MEVGLLKLDAERTLDVCKEEECKLITELWWEEDGLVKEEKSLDAELRWADDSGVDEKGPLEAGGREIDDLFEVAVNIVVEWDATRRKLEDSGALDADTKDAVLKLAFKILGLYRCEPDAELRVESEDLESPDLDEAGLVTANPEDDAWDDNDAIEINAEDEALTELDLVVICNEDSEPNEWNPEARLWEEWVLKLIPLEALPDNKLIDVIEELRLLETKTEEKANMELDLDET